jgi:mannosyltransferase OCH1-like enzyme
MSPRKNIFLVAFLVCASNIHGLTLSKLILQEVYLQNTTSQTLDVSVRFGQKCHTCSWLDNTYEQIITIPALQTILINQAQAVIKDIIPHDSTFFINVASRKPLTLSLDTTKKDFFTLLHDNFMTEVKDQKEYILLLQNHNDYKKNIPAGMNPQIFFEKLETMYQKNNLSLHSNQKATTAKIPFIIHTIWFEDKKNSYPMSNLFKEWLHEWQEKHPGWKVMLWNDNLIKKHFPEGLYNQIIYDEAHLMFDFASMSKVTRYEILHKFGGLYIDPNIKCFESFELLHKRYDFYAGLGSLKSFGTINNSVIGSKPDHPIIKSCIEYIKKNECRPGQLYHWTTTNISTHPLTHAVYEKSDQENNTDIVFPHSFFDGNNIPKEFYPRQPLYEASYAHLHHQLEAFCSRGVYSFRTL